MYFSTERNSDLAARMFNHVRNGTTDKLDDIWEYDLSIYADPEVALQERARIFERLPMMAAHSSQIPEPGSFITLRLNRTNVIVSRQKDGSVKALLNVCRHRGATVVTQESGKRPLFTCPYHGWTYGNDGTLRAISFKETFGARPCAELDLVSFPVEERHGFIWIVENPKGTINVAEHLGPGMDQLLAEYHLETYFCYRQHVFEFPQNWKIMMDGLSDSYHVQFVHGKTINPYFYPNMVSADILGRHGIVGNPRRAIDKIIDEVPGQSSLDRYVIFGNMFTPNAFMILHPHHVEFWTTYQDPTDPSKSRLHLRYLTREQTHDEKGHERLQKNWDIATAAIINEDVPIGNAIQDSASMPHTGKVRLGRNEIGNQLFHRTYHGYMHE